MSNISEVARLKRNGVKVKVDYGARTLRATWPDGFSYLYEAGADKYIHYDVAVRMALQARAKWREATRKCRKADKISPPKSDQQMIEEFIASGKIHRCDTAHCAPGTGQYATIKVEIDPTDHAKGGFMAMVTKARRRGGPGRPRKSAA